MKVILNEDVNNLGEEGDIKIVKNGFGRNFLIPRGLAVPFTQGNAKIFEARKEIIEKKKEDKRKAAMGLKEKIESVEISIPMPAGDNGRLFGSVNNAVVADCLAKQGIHIERKRIELTEHNIKMTGTYTAKVRLYENNSAQLSFSIVDEKGDKKQQADSNEEASAVSVEETKAQKPQAEAEEPVVTEPLSETGNESIEETVEEQNTTEADV